ncbi:hypothetical protein Agub_g3574 [Astrephomene gubernaculifera]|uniref:Uncharacterized protein n=1 Tax=Astrephomene gubernaculifera TaxID=47775 RepID=A0AAD3DL61_9CHLO|nr:hypothetical protein Agub_g3574 [Astrephomene gubernaculifera]
MATAVTDSVKDDILQPIKEAKTIDDRGLRSGSASGEVLRLQNVIKVKDKELEEARREITALKATLNSKDRALTQSEHELRLVRERNTIMESELANMAKELASLKVEKRKVEAHMTSIVRKSDKEQAMPALLAQEKAAVAAGHGSASRVGLAWLTGAAADAGDGKKQHHMGIFPCDGMQPVRSSSGGSEGSGGHGGAGPLPSCEQMATMQADLRMARLDGEKTAEGVKVLENMIRAKDKHIVQLQRKADEADALRDKCLEVENRYLETLKQLEEQRAACRTSADVILRRDADKTRLLAELEKTRATLEAAQETTARTGAMLKASETRCSALEQEVGVLVGQLARTSAVAQRVAVAEVRAGCKDEGTVHVTRHLEEMRFMGGEIARLQERITALEKELAVAHELKEQYRTISEMAGASSPRAFSPGASSPGAPPHIPRPGSARITAAPRRPPVSAISPRPTSAPRPANPVRASTNSIPSTRSAGGAILRDGAADAGTTASGSTTPRGSAVRASGSNTTPRPSSARHQAWDGQSPTKSKTTGSAAASPATARSTSYVSRTASSGSARTMTTKLAKLALSAGVVAGSTAASPAPEEGAVVAVVSVGGAVQAEADVKGVEGVLAGGESAAEVTV